MNPNRPHGLSDAIARMREQQWEGAYPWLPSWVDVLAVQQYLGEEAFAQGRERAGNSYAIASHVLIYLGEIEGTRVTIAPYIEIDCPKHDVSAGSACAYHDEGHHFLPIEGALPPMPSVCVHRVLTKHGRIEAGELFDRRPPREVSEDCVSPTIASRSVLPLSATVENGVAVARVQHRDPSAFQIEGICVAGGDDWLIHDICVDGVSAIAPHHDLPGAVFSTRIIGSQLPLPAVVQDQWIEIEARRVRRDAPRFYASVLGNRRYA